MTLPSPLVALLDAQGARQLARAVESRAIALMATTGALDAHQARTIAATLRHVHTAALLTSIRLERHAEALDRQDTPP